MEELKKELEAFKKRVKYLEQKQIYQMDIAPKAVKQPAIDGLIIFSGLEANLPSGASEKLAYWATDTFKLYLWTGTAWKSVQLS